MGPFEEFSTLHHLGDRAMKRNNLQDTAIALATPPPSPLFQACACNHNVKGQNCLPNLNLIMRNTNNFFVYHSNLLLFLLCYPFNNASQMLRVPATAGCPVDGIMNPTPPSQTYLVPEALALDTASFTQSLIGASLVWHILGGGRNQKRMPGEPIKEGGHEEEMRSVTSRSN